jgi:hypothetical protein
MSTTINITEVIKVNTSHVTSNKQVSAPGIDAVAPPGLRRVLEKSTPQEGK